MKFSGKGMFNDPAYWIAVALFVGAIIGGIYGWREGGGPMFWFFLVCLVFVAFFTWLYGTGRAR